MTRDLRVCFVGDSFVAGVGDPQHLGWVGRVAARSHSAGQPLTAYNLGVRRETSRQVLARWHAECAPRLPAGCDCRVVCSFGVNDTMHEGNAPRVRPEDSAAHLTSLLKDAAAAGLDTLVVGPPPISDQRQNQRTRLLDEAFARVCRDAGVGYVSVLDHLLACETWMAQVQAGDGAHPAAEAYEKFAELVWPHWLAWIK